MWEGKLSKKQIWELLLELCGAGLLCYESVLYRVPVLLNFLELLVRHLHRLRQC